MIDILMALVILALLIVIAVMISKVVLYAMQRLTGQGRTRNTEMVLCSSMTILVMIAFNSFIGGI